MDKLTSGYRLKPSHIVHRWGTILKLVELHNFLNDIITDSPHMGGVKSTAGLSTTLGGRQPTKKRTYEDPLAEAQ
jgi:hypothetical protein